MVIAPSILAADFGRLAEEVRAVAKAGADWIHVDVMDGRFVPNLTVGPPVVRSLRRVTELPLDVHLMMVEPERYVPAFAEAGASTITVHAEACPHLHRTLQQIRDLGVQAGVALNPHTPETVLDYLLGELDLVLVMSVNPGFGGQRFIAGVCDKIRRLRERVDLGAGTFRIEVDGGINPETASAVIDAGADTLVAGTAVFGAEDYKAAMDSLREPG